MALSIKIFSTEISRYHTQYNIMASLLFCSWVGSRYAECDNANTREIIPFLYDLNSLSTKSDIKVKILTYFLKIAARSIEFELNGAGLGLLA
jgi:hypothetical protein